MLVMPITQLRDRHPMGIITDKRQWGDQRPGDYRVQMPPNWDGSVKTVPIDAEFIDHACSQRSPLPASGIDGQKRGQIVHQAIDPG